MGCRHSLRSAIRPNERLPFWRVFPLAFAQNLSEWTGRNRFFHLNWNSDRIYLSCFTKSEYEFWELSLEMTLRCLFSASVIFELNLGQLFLFLRVVVKLFSWIWRLFGHIGELKGWFTRRTQTQAQVRSHVERKRKHVEIRTRNWVSQDGGRSYP